MNAAHHYNYTTIPVPGGIGLKFLLVFLAAQALLLTSAGSAERNGPNAELLKLQRELVETLHTQSEEMRADERVGQRTDLQNIVYAAEAYFRELETQQVMEARNNKKVMSEKELLQIRADVRTKASSYFSELQEYGNGRYVAGEIRQSDFAAIKAAMLNAQIKLETLKGAGGR